jgi:hypothetical protein
VLSLQAILREKFAPLLHHTLTNTATPFDCDVCHPFTSIPGDAVFAPVLQSPMGVAALKSLDPRSTSQHAATLLKAVAPAIDLLLRLQGVCAL